MDCPNCGSANPKGKRFCGDCGSLLASLKGDREAERTAGGSKPPTPRLQPVSWPIDTSSPAERRQITVMFCDLVGSTALASRLDPEDLRELIGAYHRCAAETAAQFDGFVARYMGDGVLVYFGYPHAHEDDAERAVRLGLALIEAVDRLHFEAITKLQVRIGVSTGLVVVGDLVGSGEVRERAAIGETPNLAARLQSLAEPNAVVIEPRTRRLLGNLFEYRDLGTVEVKGLNELVHAYQVLRPSVVESRFEALHASTLASLVGRDAERELLLRDWEQAKKGDGQVVLLSGEPGIGKSRIAATLQEDIKTEPHARLRYFCSPYHAESALYPIINGLERMAGFERKDTPDIRIGKLEALLAPTCPPKEEMALLAELLSLPVEDRYPPLELALQLKKVKTFEALVRHMEAVARRQPVLMIFEDIHWIDPSSRELLDLLIERVRHLPVLLLVTFRPELNPRLAGPPHVTPMTLNRLGQRDGAALVKQIDGDHCLTSEMIEEIVSRADGVPLFLEELTKAVLEVAEDGSASNAVILAAPPPAILVPATLYASLMARLDRLGPEAKTVAQVGSALGREFSHELLAALAGASEAELRATLSRLSEAGLILSQGAPPRATYLFKHALVQDAAYGTLLRGPRRELHGRIAETLETRFPETAMGQPEILAHHCEEAGRIEKALSYRFKAGQKALARSAMTEALVQMRKGLALLNRLPESDGHQQQELDLLILLGQALIAIKGFGASDVSEVLVRARQLCDQLGHPPQFIRVLWGQWMQHLSRGELATSSQVADEMLG